MKERNRTFLLGAGFSKKVAGGPLMDEIWEYIKQAYDHEKIRKAISGGNNRLEWFKRLDDFIKKLESEATSEFNINRYDHIKVGIRENLEYLFTLIDLHLIGPKIEFKKEGVDISPYPVIPLRLINEFDLKEIKTYLLTFLYKVFERLPINSIAGKFAEIIDAKDQFITFNYDLALEKVLWDRKIWSPLNGYVGVNKFETESDYERLKEAGRDSKLKIHKMHGSLDWVNSEIILSGSDNPILIELDNMEIWDFHFAGLEEILKREPIKPSGHMDAQVSPGYVGKHNPPWLLPSFIKPFDMREFYEIWQSALEVMSTTDELVVIGYSFRTEDSNSRLLLALLPNGCNLILIDPKPEEVERRLEQIGFRVNKIYKDLEEYLSL